MADKISDAILSYASSYGVGLVKRVEGAGSKVFGSGVLVSIEGRRGILTCGHVAQVYKDLPEIGLIRFAVGSQQRLIIDLDKTATVVLRSGNDWTQDGIDLAFTQFTPEVASSIEARTLFLSLERNKEKTEAGPPTDKVNYCDAVMGLVEEFSETPFKENGRFISPVLSLLQCGRIVGQEHGLLTFGVSELNLEEAPESLGGMSGGGLWRAYFIEGQDGPQLVQAILCGVASYQIDGRKIVCQGWDRIDQALIPTVREKQRL